MADLSCFALVVFVVGFVFELFVGAGGEGYGEAEGA